jgi:short-subunit dehydrogenase
VKGKKIPTSEEVAKYGYEAMKKSKTVVIHGLKNKVLASSVRFAPRSLITKISRKVIEEN